MLCTESSKSREKIKFLGNKLKNGQVNKMFTRFINLHGGIKGEVQSLFPAKMLNFQADLVDVQSLSRYNKGFKYLLTCVDIFSKYASVIPLKTKQGQELVKAFRTILSSGRKPLKLQTDKGTVTVHLQNDAELYFGDLGYVLGFSPEEDISKSSTAETEVDLEHGFHDLYVYCDIIQPQYVGDTFVPLLRIIPVEGEDGQRISKSFVHYTYLSAESSSKV